MPTLLNKSDNGRGLKIDQETFFIKGYTWSFLGDRKYPFADEEERASLYEKYRDHLIKKMHHPRNAAYFGNNDLRVPNSNCLRPQEWWRRDSPEPKRIFNDAKLIRFGIYTKQPALETDYEFILRTNLLTDMDKAYIKVSSFADEEERTIRYRNYFLNLESRTLTKVEGPDQGTSDENVLKS